MIEPTPGQRRLAHATRRALPLIAGLAIFACLAAPLTAQRGAGGKASWKIPHRGFLSYLREQDSEPRHMFADGKYLSGFSVNNPSVLLQGELDSSQRFLKEDPGSLWEVAMHTAFDLRMVNRAGKIDQTYWFLASFGAVQIHGKASAVDENGRQKLELQIRRVPLPPGRYPSRVLTFLNQQNQSTLTGTLKIERHYLPDLHRIASFKSNLTIQIDGRAARLREEWIFKAAMPNRYPGFAQRVAAAIKMGGEYCKRQITKLNRQDIAAAPNGEGRTVGTGLLALCLLTMVKAEVSRQDPVLVAGFDELRRRNITDTYSLAIAIMAMEALYAPPDERQMLIERRIDAPVPRKPTAPDLAVIKGWTERLLQHTDASIKDLAYTRRHYYRPGAKQYDNSNTQYATLGLYSAQLCGVEISPTVWHALANHWLSDRLPDGKPVALDLVSHQDYAELRVAANKKKPKRRTIGRGKKIPPSGWPYTTLKLVNTQHMMPLTLSMTAAGITGLTICQAALQSRAAPDKKKRPKRRTRRKKNSKREKKPSEKELYRQFETARDQGYAWLLDNFSLRCNKHRLGYGFHFYYLYGIERACELGQIALIGDRDWYFEGSTMILGMLDDRSGYLPAGTLYSTCFAILFLKQAAPPLPAITGRRIK